MVVWRGVQSRCGVFFQTCNRIHSDRLQFLILHSAGGWCLVVGGRVQLFYEMGSLTHRIYKWPGPFLRQEKGG